MIPEFSPPRVLVIEDDPDALENLRDILELDDYRVETAVSAQESLRPRQWAEIDVVILDRRLPDGTADELLPKLKRVAPGAAYVVVTGHSDIDGAIAALRLGASDYLLKPLNADALRIRLGRLMEQRRLERAKARSDALFRQLVESAECMIVLLRSDHSITYFSPHAEHLTQYKSEEAIGCNYLSCFIPDADREAAAAQYRGVLAGIPVRGLARRIVCRDGTIRWVVENASAVADYDGAPAVLVVKHDITALKQAQDRVLQAERLAAIGQMSAGLAHESGNALQRIQACLEMLALKVEDRPDALNLIERIQNAQDDLRMLFDDVKGYAAPIALARSECSLANIWRESWAQLENARAGKTAVLRESIDAVNAYCFCDPFRMRQVCRNIFENSLAACAGSVVIEIRASDVLFEGRPALRLSFHDNGPGLGPEQRNRIFEAFFTTKTKGTGLGMAIVRRIIEAHGGRIEVGEGNPGAEIVITIPRENP